MEYYQLGKVFRNQQILKTETAQIASKTSIISALTESRIEEEQKTFELRFFIYTISGRAVPNTVLLENNMENDKVVLIPSGCAFLVCKTEKKDDNTLFVYLREINVGLHKDVFLWCNHDLNKHANAKYLDWINWSNCYKSVGKQKTSEYILKTYSITVRAFLDSIFFRKTLEYCDSFTFVQNMDRPNEDRITVDFYKKAS